MSDDWGDVNDMLSRRKILTGVGAGMASLAGCSGDSEDGNTPTTQEDTPAGTTPGSEPDETSSSEEESISYREAVQQLPSVSSLDNTLLSSFTAAGSTPKVFQVNPEWFAKNRDVWDDEMVVGNDDSDRQYWFAARGYLSNASPFTAFSLAGFELDEVGHHTAEYLTGPPTAAEGQIGFYSPDVSQEVAVSRMKEAGLEEFDAVDGYPVFGGEMSMFSNVDGFIRREGDDDRKATTMQIVGPENVYHVSDWDYADLPNAFDGRVELLEIMVKEDWDNSFYEDSGGMTQETINFLDGVDADYRQTVHTNPDSDSSSVPSGFFSGFAEKYSGDGVQNTFYFPGTGESVNFENPWDKELIWYPDDPRNSGWTNSP